jgi:hypothetical protein
MEVGMTNLIKPRLKVPKLRDKRGWFFLFLEFVFGGGSTVTIIEKG